MSIKPQDIVILAKLLSKGADKNWSQNSIAHELCLSPSQINSGFKRLVEAGFLMPYHSSEKTQPILQACEEFFIHGLKYVFPAKLGQVVRGIPTSYAGPILSDEIIKGNEPTPVWPYGEGDERGVALKPLYSSVPQSISKHPDSLFYDLLCLIDAIRSGRARERELAKQKLIEIFKSKSGKYTQGDA